MERQVFYLFKYVWRRLGNSNGCRYIVEQYKNRIKSFISFDGYLNQCTNSAVGSKRYRLTVHCQGGHSYADFGKENAIETLSKIMYELSHQQIPQKLKQLIILEK